MSGVDFGVKVTKKPRPSKVCVTCRRRKLRCDRLRPSCTRCIKHSLNCAYEVDDVLPSIANSSIPLTPGAQVVDYSSSESSDTLQHQRSNEQRNIFVDEPKNKVGSKPSKSSSLSSSHHSSVAASDTTTVADCDEPLYIPDSFENLSMKLWNTEDTIVLFGSTRFIESPFSIHTSIQLDRYSRALFSAVHGASLINLQKRIDDQNNPESDKSWATEKTNPLMFLDKAILIYFEFEALQYQKPHHCDLICGKMSVDDNMKPEYKEFLNKIYKEIEADLSDQNEINEHLKYFYQNIYPSYPFMEIAAFEQVLPTILKPTNNNRFVIDSSEKDIRQKVETLTLFLILQSLSLQAPKNDKASRDLARKLMVHADRLLSTLDTLKTTNEQSFTCLLYMFVASHLNPSSLELHISHSVLLKLNFLQEYAMTLGLCQQPSNYKRLLFLDNESPLKLLQVRKKLWVGLQMIKFEVALIVGHVKPQELQYCLEFIENDRISFQEKNLPNSILFDSMMNFTVEKKYQFHMSLLKMLTSYSELSGKGHLFTIMDNIKHVQESMSQMFPTENLFADSFSNDYQRTKFWRDSTVSDGILVDVEILKANLIGLTSVLNVFTLLIYFFEKKCKTDWQKYQSYLQFFCIEFFKTYSKLIQLIFNYFRYCVDCDTYALNKTLAFILTKVMLTQISILLRLSYLEKLKSSDPQLCSLIKIEKDFIAGHMRLILDFLMKGKANKIYREYLLVMESVYMFQYLLYLNDADLLMEAIERYWKSSRQLMSNDEFIQRTQNKIFMKWGIHHRDSHFLLQDLSDTNVLSTMDCNLLKQINCLLRKIDSNLAKEVSSCKSISGKTPQTLETISPNTLFETNNSDDVLNHFLQNNSEWFSKLIDEHLGELPVL